MKALTISNRGLSNLQSYLQDDNTFLFKIGERKLKVHQILAAFISPKVAHMHTIDPTLESFEINLTSKSIFYQQYKTYALTTGKDKVEEKIINIITSITEGIPLNAVPDDHDLYHFLSKVLDNPEIYTAFTTIFPFEININNCLSTLYQIISTSSNFNAENDEFENPEFQRVVNFIASNFGTLLEKKVSRFSLFDIPLNILIIILRKENLNIKNVDSFASFILDLSLKGLLTKENEVDFLELIDFSHISGPIFTKVMDQLDPKNFNSFIWQKLLACFPKYEGSQILNNPKKRSNSNNNISQTPSNKAEGIIKKLMKCYDNTILEKDIISISSSPSILGYGPEKAFDFKNPKTYYSSLDNLNSWICIDFKKFGIQPFGYAISTHSEADIGGFHLSNWDVKGSNDKNVWDILDSRKNEKGLDKSGAFKKFSLTNPLGKLYRFLKIQVTGINTGGNYKMSISSLDFYGNIVNS